MAQCSLPSLLVLNMKKLIASFYSGKASCIYYIDISEDRKNFRFSPSIHNKDLPFFSLRLVDGKLVTKGRAKKNLRLQAEKEIESILSLRLPDKIDSMIWKSFIGEPSVVVVSGE
jgi:hypothetical protein